jgi:hypothetical protein
MGLQRTIRTKILCVMQIKSAHVSFGVVTIGSGVVDSSLLGYNALSVGRYVEASWGGFLPTFSGSTYFKKDFNYLNPVDGGMRLFQNVSSCLPVYAVAHPRR